MGFDRRSDDRRDSGRGAGRDDNRGGFRGGDRERGGDRPSFRGGDDRGRGGDRQPFRGRDGDRPSFQGGDRRPFRGRDGDGGRDGGRPFRGGDRGGDRPGSRPAPKDFKSGPKGGDRGFKGGARTVVEPHPKYPGIFISRGRADVLVTRSMAPGVSVYGEKRVSVEDGAAKVEYREWNPFRSKLGAAVRLQVRDLPIAPGMKVLYLGAASGTTVSHVSDIVGPTGSVYAVEFSTRSGRDLLECAKARSNVYPIIADARHPYKYRMIVPEVDAIFSDVAQPDQARIVGENARFFLKQNGGMMISIKASSVDSTMKPEAVFAREIEVLRECEFKCKEQLDIDEFHRNHAIVVGRYRVSS